MGNAEPLDQEEINKFVTGNPDWRYEDGRLKAEFTLESFEKAIQVINQIAKVCERMNHHPLMSNVYNRLMFSLCTHRTDDKVTALDVELAKMISDILKSS